MFCDDGGEREMGDENGNEMEDTSGYEMSGVLIGLGRPRIGVFTLWNGSSTCYIRNGKLTRTRNSHTSQFLMMISPISFSSLILYHHLRT